MSQLIPNPVESALLEPLVLKIAPSYRRCAWYGLIGGLLVVAMSQIVPRPAGREVALLPLGFFFVVPPLLLLITALSWRMRIDHRGIARRRWWWWSLWPWEAFADGRVRLKSLGFSCTYKDRPAWDQQLTVALLEPANAELVWNYIKLASSGAPPETTLPEKIVANAWRRRLAFTPEGIEFRNRGQAEPIAWDDVQHVRIEWQEQKGLTYGAVKLQVARREPIEAYIYRFDIALEKRRGNLRVTDVEAAKRLFASALPGDRWESVRSFGEARNLTEAQFQKESAEKWLSSTRWLSAFSLLVVAGFYLMLPIGMGIKLGNDPWLPLGWKIAFVGCLALKGIGISLVMGWLILRQRRRVQRRIEELDAFLLTGGRGMAAATIMYSSTANPMA